MIFNEMKPGHETALRIFMLQLHAIDCRFTYVDCASMQIDLDTMYTRNQEVRGRTNHTTMHFDNNISIKGTSGDPFLLLLYPFQYVCEKSNLSLAVVSSFANP